MYPIAVLIALVFIEKLDTQGVNAHGHVISPRSRNYVANQDGKWSGGTANDPKIETCPHCLNRGGICGSAGSHNYNTPVNTFGDPMPVNIQKNFQQGQEYEFSAVLTAHHKGHFEYKACPIRAGEVPTQDCFDRYPLEFVQDIFYNAPKDPNFPERAYIPLSSHSTVKEGSNYLYTHRFKLPMDLTGDAGDLVLIQWHYVTANSCLPEGYEDYAWPPEFYPGNLKTCGPLPEDGNGTPEQFWNCIEVTITPSNQTPVEPPTVSPVMPPTRSPTMSPTPPLVPTISPVSPTNPPIDGPVLPVICTPGYTGLVPVSGCTGDFYHCNNGSLVSETPIQCAEGLLYSSDQLCMCNFIFLL